MNILSTLATGKSCALNKTDILSLFVCAAATEQNRNGNNRIRNLTRDFIVSPFLFTNILFWAL
ncbi:MAG TPA: hypothetical protein PKI18_07545, partial [Candidatus Cloacimonas sp.]|nr:hypothetical protein [Candidatus Cloacimonas sp.]